MADRRVCTKHNVLMQVHVDRDGNEEEYCPACEQEAQQKVLGLPVMTKECDHRMCALLKRVDYELDEHLEAQIRNVARYNRGTAEKVAALEAKVDNIANLACEGQERLEASVQALAEKEDTTFQLLGEVLDILANARKRPTPQQPASAPPACRYCGQPTHWTDEGWCCDTCESGEPASAPASEPTCNYHPDHPERWPAGWRPPASGQPRSCDRCGKPSTHEVEGQGTVWYFCDKCHPKQGQPRERYDAGLKRWVLEMADIEPAPAQQPPCEHVWDWKVEIKHCSECDDLIKGPREKLPPGWSAEPAPQQQPRCPTCGQKYGQTGEGLDVDAMVLEHPAPEYYGTCLACGGPLPAPRQQPSCGMDLERCDGEECAYFDEHHADICTYKEQPAPAQGQPRGHCPRCGAEFGFSRHWGCVNCGWDDRLDTPDARPKQGQPDCPDCYAADWDTTGEGFLRCGKCGKVFGVDDPLPPAPAPWQPPDCGKCPLDRLEPQDGSDPPRCDDCPRQPREGGGQ